MRKLFSKKTVVVLALSLVGFGFILKIVPFGPKLPPVEFLQNAPDVKNITIHFL